MNDKLSKKVIKFEHGISNKKRRLRKPWWNETLSIMWNEMCIKEREWLREKNITVRARNKALFISKRKEFDKAVRKSKRQFKKS